jgi:hypothetical protein
MQLLVKYQVGINTLKMVDDLQASKLDRVRVISIFQETVKTSIFFLWDFLWKIYIIS